MRRLVVLTVVLAAGCTPMQGEDTESFRANAAAVSEAIGTPLRVAVWEGEAECGGQAFAFAARSEAQDFTDLPFGLEVDPASSRQENAETIFRVTQTSIFYVEGECGTRVLRLFADPIRHTDEVMSSAASEAEAETNDWYVRKIGFHAVGEIEMVSADGREGWRPRSIVTALEFIYTGTGENRVPPTFDIDCGPPASTGSWPRPNPGLLVQLCRPEASVEDFSTGLEEYTRSCPRLF